MKDSNRLCIAKKWLEIKTKKEAKKSYLYLAKILKILYKS